MLTSITIEWASLIFRWMHVVAAVGWIGSSFYFIHLDLSLKKRPGLPDGVSGDAWQVHGGGFYNIVKYLVAPSRMPDEPNWFHWEAYATWLSGFALVIIVYYLDAELFLVDKSMMDLTPLQAVAALVAGKQPDPELGLQGKQRSGHNNYLTLPVIVLMISNHYPLLFATRYNWVIVAIVLALGPIIRHFYNSRHAGKGSPWWTWEVAGVGMLAILWLSAAGPRQTSGAAATPTFQTVHGIVMSGWAVCHAAEPVWATIRAAPRGILLDEPDHIRGNARLIARNAVWSNAMPPGNVTDMTLDERRILAAWIDASAPPH